jgi:hypothetical protein
MKKTLLIAAAALAAGVISTQAQVYSQNIVGYVNVVMPAGPSYTLLASPFDDGKGNSATNWLDPNNTLPNKTQILTWNGSTFNNCGKAGGAWAASAATTFIPPGTGFFVVLPPAQTTAITNTFVGTVTVPSGGSVTNSLPSGYSLWGSPIPFAGDLITSTNLAVIPIGTLLTANKSQILTWNGSTYNVAGLVAGTWQNGPANLNVGQGFFIVNRGAATNWVQQANY